MSSVRTIFLTGIVAVGFGAFSFASEQTIRRADLPAAVQKTAETQSKGATIRRFVKDEEEGHLEYEMELTVDGHSKDVSIAPDGKLLEIEEQVLLESLPGNVLQALQTEVGHGTITKVESITKHGRIVAYEAQVRTAGKHSGIQVGPDGRALDHEE
jgi:hypothetical protein